MSTENGRPESEWICLVAPGRTVRLKDIPSRQLIDLEHQFHTSWMRLVGRPYDIEEPNVEQALAIYEKCCTIAGVEPRELTAGDLAELFEYVEDDRPLSYTAGLPDPKADAQTTVG